MAKIKDLPKFKRPREKLFEKGTDALKDHELLGILLRSGYQGKSALEVAKRILRTKKLDELAELSPTELAKIKGVGESRAAIITAALALARRVFLNDESVAIKTPADVVKVVNSLAEKKKEYLVALYLNARNRVIKQQTISVGTLTASLIHPREVFAPAIQNHAAQLILVHNHPSGDVEPSLEDIHITERLVEVGNILGIKVIDHVILAQNNFFSFNGKSSYSS